jgi:hypothetical protein
VLSYLRRRAQLKGVVGGSKGWTVVWAILIGGRVLRRLTSDEEKVVYRRKLRPGESLVIRSEKPGAEQTAG